MNINNAIKSAFKHYQTGNLQQAENICKKILLKKPNNSNTTNLLGVVYYQIGNYDFAIKYFKKTIELNPLHDEAYNNLGLALKGVGQIDKAISCYRHAIKLNPNNFNYYFNLGFVFQEQHKLNEAISCYQKAIDLNPNYFDAYSNLGAVFQEQHKLNEAISCYQKAIDLNPNYFDAYNNLGAVLITQGKLNEGIRCFKKALQINPNYPQALFNLVDKQRLSNDDSKELFKLAKELIKQDMSKNDSIHIYFAMGKLCFNLKMFTESFEYYRLGNMLKRAQVKFNINSLVDVLSRTKETFSADFIKYRKSWGSNSEMPIFIFGMPRSGTTLLEQIIASHPNVYGGGELQFFNQIDQKLAPSLKANKPYPECLSFIDDGTTHDIAELYLKETRTLVNYTRITDKNPYNFLHLGLISLLFPKASFIHCQRHPLDTCISIYFQNFSTHNYFAYDLNELGEYYLEYLKLMNHWRQVLPINIFELKYEDIVQQPEKVSRKLIEFCGLEWDSSCLDFYKKDHLVFTASAWQVRQPIYTTSCGRWQKYEQFLDPLKELLADFI